MVHSFYNKRSKEVAKRMMFCRGPSSKVFYFLKPGSCVSKLSYWEYAGAESCTERKDSRKCFYSEFVDV